MHTLRRRLHTMTLLHLHTTPHYTQNNDAIYTQRRFYTHGDAFNIYSQMPPYTCTTKTPYTHTTEIYTYSDVFYIYRRLRLIHKKDTL